MPERRTATTSSSTSTTRPTTSVRRNLFHQHLSRRPTTSSTSTSAETIRFDQHADGADDDASSEIVIRNGNGDFETGGDAGMSALDGDEDMGGEGIEDEKERQRLAEMVRRHQRNRAPSEPAELLENVRASLRAKVTALADDNWMYEPEPEALNR